MPGGICIYTNYMTDNADTTPAPEGVEVVASPPPEPAPAPAPEPAPDLPQADPEPAPDPEISTKPLRLREWVEYRDLTGTYQDAIVIGPSAGTSKFKEGQEDNVTLSVLYPSGKVRLRGIRQGDEPGEYQRKG